MSCTAFMFNVNHMPFRMPSQLIGKSQSDENRGLYNRLQRSEENLKVSTTMPVEARFQPSSNTQPYPQYYYMDDYEEWNAGAGQPRSSFIPVVESMARKEAKSARRPTVNSYNYDLDGQPPHSLPLIDTPLAMSNPFGKYSAEPETCIKYLGDHPQNLKLKI
uniref:Uncharacterized protein n=1 Tax=Ditylenchus dipsaci TaxID=166011 RepID=A0A915CLM9_9BILA